MKIDPQNENHLIADEGKVLKRISDNIIFGKDIILGYTYFINGIKLDEPKLEKPSDFTEIDEPNNEDNS